MQKTVDSLLQGMCCFRDHKAEAQSQMRQTFKLTDQVHLDDGYSRQGELMARDPTPRPELYADLIDAISRISPDVKKVDLSRLLDPRFAQDAVKRGLAG